MRSASPAFRIDRDQEQAVWPNKCFRAVSCDLQRWKS